MTAPRGLSVRGKRLWTSLLAQDGALEIEDNPLRDAAEQACRHADRADVLAAEVASEMDGDRRLRLLAEERHQSVTMARLISALRLPDAASGKKPQRRQLRGVQAPSKVSSLDRARQRAGA